MAKTMLELQPMTIVLDASIKDNCLFFWGHTSNGKIGPTCLSQWYPAKFKEEIQDLQGNVVQTITYFCAEQYMMAHKALLFNDLDSFNKIRDSRTAKECKQLGREVKDFNQKFWDAHKFDLVVNGNILKFSQNPELANYLSSTGKKVILEASPYDRIWGIGYSKDEAWNNRNNWGQNLLGKALMTVREYIANKYTSPIYVKY